VKRYTHITRETHSINNIDWDRRNRIALVEICADDHREIMPKRFFVIQHGKGGQVLSVVPADCPNEGGVWFGTWGPRGIAYVSQGRTRATARRWFNRLTA